MTIIGAPKAKYAYFAIFGVSLKRSWKMQFRHLGLRSIGPSEVHSNTPNNMQKVVTKFNFLPDLPIVITM